MYVELNSKMSINQKLFREYALFLNDTTIGFGSLSSKVQYGVVFCEMICKGRRWLAHEEFTLGPVRKVYKKEK